MIELINKNNFFDSTSANFISVEKPNRPADYTSDSGSEYWFTDNGIIRGSDHWSYTASAVIVKKNGEETECFVCENVASCVWTIDEVNYSELKVRSPEKIELKGTIKEKWDRVKKLITNREEDSEYELLSIDFKYTKSGKVSPTQINFAQTSKIKSIRKSYGFCAFNEFESIENQKNYIAV